MIHAFSKLTKISGFLVPWPRNCQILRFCDFLLALSFLLGTSKTYSQVSTIPETVQQEKNAEVRREIVKNLERFCPSLCELIDVQAQLEEDFSDNSELGFEALSPLKNTSVYRPIAIAVSIQVDEKVGANNRARLEDVLKNKLSRFSSNVEFDWKTVRLPQIGEDEQQAAASRAAIKKRVSDALEEVISTYCPDKCFISATEVEGAPISSDEAAAFSGKQTVFQKGNNSLFRIDGINVEVSIDEQMQGGRKNQIEDLMRSKTRFYEPVNFNFRSVAFPATHAEEQGLGNDPYGLEKLRQTLIMFRDLAGTKEILSKTEIETTASNSENRENTNRSASVNSTDRETLNKEVLNSQSQINSTSESKDSLESSSSNSSSSDEKKSFIEDPYVWGGVFIALLIITFMGIRFSQARKDARLLSDASMQGNSPSQAAYSNQPFAIGNPTSIGAFDRGVTGAALNVVRRDSETEKYLLVEKLKDEMLSTFAKQQRVAKETFARMLREDGVEFTAQYLHIFGHVIVLELVDDPNMRRDLYALSEFFHKSRENLDLDTTYDLLKGLKSRITAAEIKILSSKNDAKFEFLMKLDPSQIYNLVKDEGMRTQSIILTQLDRKKRLAVFDMYQGNGKLELMDELSRADSIPREFLHNVAKAIAKKISERPEFDAESLRTTDIIMDLLERSDLGEQRAIMANLMGKNVDTARAIMTSLVTIEMLPYLKDGHLLEVVLGMEREDLLIFLAGTKQNIQRLLLSKAPGELAESWLEDLESIGSVPSEKFKIVELKIFSKIRTLADSGAISLLDINRLVFALDGRGPAPSQARNQGPSPISPNAYAA